MRKLKVVIGVFILMSLILMANPMISFATDNQQATAIWQTKASMSTERCYFRTEILDGKICAIGGSSANGVTNTVELYDPIINKWTALASMNTARYLFCTEMIDGKIYAIGGKDVNNKEINSVEKYDPTTNKWTPLASMSTARSQFRTEVIDGKIYVIGGSNSNGITNAVEKYDPVTDKWTSLASMSIGRVLFQTEVIDGKIYVIGGSNSNGETNTVEKYDPTTNNWITLASMSIARNSFQTNVIGNKIYAIGGYNKTAIDIVEVYDLSTNKWTSLASIPVAECWAESEKINGKIFVIGGHNGAITYNALEVYDPIMNKWISLASMSSERTLFQTKVLNNMIYAIGGKNDNGKTSSLEVYTVVQDNLSAPENLSAIADNTQIKLSWEAVDGATNYNIKRSEVAGGPYTTISSVSGSAVTFTDTDVTKGKTYYYVVSALASGTESQNSNEASATVDNSSTIDGNRAILLISFKDGKEKEYDLSAKEADAFVNWYDKRSDGMGKSYFYLPKYCNVKPFISRKEYIKFDNIESFEIKSYNE